MPQTITNILMVGPQGPFGEVIDHLEEQGNLSLHCAADYEVASLYLNEYSPNVIIVAIGRNEQDHTQALEWLRIFKSLAPVLIFSPTEDTQFHTNAIQNGAFDFLTTFTPLDEIDWSINNAVTREVGRISEGHWDDGRPILAGNRNK